MASTESVLKYRPQSRLSIQRIDVGSDPTRLSQFRGTDDHAAESLKLLYLTLDASSLASIFERFPHMHERVKTLCHGCVSRASTTQNTADTAAR